jgi:hypothetical protein
MNIVRKYHMPVIVPILIMSILLLSSCAHREVVDSCLKGYTYGFLGGLWHGFIAPFDLIGMLLWNDVTMYAQNNNGVGYALGFLLGSGGWGLFGGKTIFGRRRRS